MIAGLLKPTSGRIIVNGHDLATAPEPAKASLGFIPDRPFRYEKLTAGEFLRFHGGLYGLDGNGVVGRVRETAHILDERGHMATLERRGDGYMLTEHNCPVSRVATECDITCESELSFIRRLTDADVAQVSIAPNGRGGCRYMIRERGTADLPVPRAASS